MKYGKYVAAGVVAGYLLGRTRKMKLALTVGALVVGQKADVLGMARRGVELLQSNADVKELTENVRGGVKTTGRAAATAAASRGIDSLSDNLQRRADRLRGDGADEEPEGDHDEAEPTDADDGAEDDGDRTSTRSGKATQGKSARQGSGAKKKSTSGKKTPSNASSRGSTASRQRRSAANG